MRRVLWLLACMPMLVSITYADAQKKNIRAKRLSAESKQPMMRAQTSLNIKTNVLTINCLESPTGICHYIFFTRDNENQGKSADKNNKEHKFNKIAQRKIKVGQSAEIRKLPKEYEFCSSTKPKLEMSTCRSRDYPPKPQRADLSFKPKVNAPFFKLGEGPNVAIDSAHNNFHTIDGRYAPFAKLLREDGYSVTDGSESFTDESLKRLDILVIANAISSIRNSDNAAVFNTDEISALKRWIKQGGALLLIADHPPFVSGAQEVASTFGFEFINASPQLKGEAFSVSDGTLKTHFITAGTTPAEKVEQFMTFTGSAFKAPANANPILVLPESTIAVDRSSTKANKIDVGGLLQGALVHYGKGRIAVFAEAGAFTAQISGRNGRKFGMNHPSATQNAQFILNVLHWLSGSDNA